VLHIWDFHFVFFFFFLTNIINEINKSRALADVDAYLWMVSIHCHQRAK